MRELPLMGAFQFRILWERLFTHLASPAMWGKARGGIYHQQWPKGEWRSHPYANLSYGWGERRKSGHGDHLLLP